MLAEITAELALRVVKAGGHFTVENPRTSLLWQMPFMEALRIETGAVMVEFDMCAYGMSMGPPGTFTMKSTMMMASHQAFYILTATCPGRSWNHKHVALRGRRWNPAAKAHRFITGEAKIYPEELCDRYATAAQQVFPHDPPLAVVRRADPVGVRQFSKEFQLKADQGKRKREHGTFTQRKTHRQEKTATMAIAAGYQMKHGAFPPLLSWEMEPGEALRTVIEGDHPMAKDAPLRPDVPPLIHGVVEFASDINGWREEAIGRWEKRAEELKPASLKEIREIEDPYIR